MGDACSGPHIRPEKLKPAAALIWCPFATKDDALKAGRTLLDERLIACVNIMPAMHSLFIWQGKAEESTECGALFKLDARRLDQAIARLKTLHPYQAPAIIGWRCDAASPETLGWLTGNGS